MAEFTTMDATAELETPENGQIDEPAISQASPVSDDYDPSVPTDEKDSAAEITPAKMKVAELRTELTNRGLDAKGNKAALIQRLEEALETTEEDQAPDDVVDESEAGVEEEQNEEEEEEEEEEKEKEKEEEDEVTMVDNVEEVEEDDVQEVITLEEETSGKSEEEKGSEGNVELVEDIADDDGDSAATENAEAQESEEVGMDMEVFAGTEEDRDSPDVQEVVPEATEEMEQSQEEPVEQPMEQESTEPAKPAQTEKAKPKQLVPKAKVVIKEKPKQEPKVATTALAKPQEKKAEKGKPATGDAKAPAATAKDGKVTASVAKPKGKEEVKAEQGPPAELEKYWKAVKDKPTDFTGWTYLLQYVEQQNHMPSVRDAFDAFLARYPYCYGYWKKYADMERKKSKSVQKSTEVFESGLRAIPLSSDLWMQYIQFVGQTASTEEATEKLRGVYAKAIAAAGTDFRSDKLWDMFINFEKDKKDWQRVTKIYDQLLTIPTQLYSHHFEKFKEHVKKHHPKDILSIDEFIKLRMEVVEVLGLAEPGIDEGDEGGDDAPPGEDDDAPPGVEVAPPGLEPASTKRAASSKQVEAENEAIRKKVLESRAAVYRQTEQEVSKRWAYEEGIRRPYFHAKPLEKSQLKNWREYLDFETTNGTHERVLILYERCLVACALYEEFWMRYAKYLEPHSTEGVSSVYKRACSIHLTKKPSIHLRWAAFEEKQGNKTAAREILKKLEENVPDLVMVTLERVSLERRIGNMQEVVGILKDRLEAHKKPEIKAFFAMKLSRYYMKVLNDVGNARSVLYDTLQQAKDKVIVYLQLLDLEIQQVPNNECIILDLFQKGIDASTNVVDKMRFSQRQLTYLMDFGTDVSKLQTAYEAHQVLLKEQLDILQTANKKRSAEAIEMIAQYQLPGAHASPITAVAAVERPAKPVHVGLAYSGWKRGSDLSSLKGESTPAKKAKPDASTPTTPAATPKSVAPKPQPLLSTPAASQPAPAPAGPSQDYTQQSPQGAAWSGYNQSPYSQQGGNYGPPPQGPPPGGYSQPPPNYNQQYQQYQQAWGGYNQGYYPR